MKYFCKLSNLFLVLALLVGLLGLAQPAQASAPLMADLWVPNGSVQAILLSGSTLYIGGNFTYVGPPTGSFAALDAGGAPDRAFPPVSGTINAIAPDGAGGWYVGGTFTSVGGHPRNNLAHLKADKSLDFAWNPNPNGQVKALLVNSSTLYVGGKFTTIGGQTRNYLAALDTGTGLATAWNPNPNWWVHSLAVPPTSGGSSSIIYVGGEFTSISWRPRNRIAALDTGTGNATNWDPNADGVVSSLVVVAPTSGVGSNTIYAGGYFTNIGGQARNYIAALDAGTATATTWNPNASGIVKALAVAAPTSGGSTIYAGGEFSSIGGQSRKYIAALDAGTGSATSWDPNASAIVNALVAVPPISGASSGTIYAGGDFTSIGGQSRNYIAALDAGIGSATTWDPNANNPTYALAVASPTSGVSYSTISAGGSFTSIGGQNRNYIAALDTGTGALTTWNPNASGGVYTLAQDGSTIYAGGIFTSIGGQDRKYIAALDANTGKATTWNPGADGVVLTLAVGNSGTIYAGGWFLSIGGAQRTYIAALDASTGKATNWRPNANFTVTSLAVDGSTIYAGGYFTNIGWQNRNYIAALDANTGIATLWNPNANDRVNTLTMAPAISGERSSTIYVGGQFTIIGGQFRNRIAALDASIGTAMAWDPNANNPVYELTASGSTVYAGGSFTTIGGQPRNYIAALDTIIGDATAWNPNANNTVSVLVVAPPTSETNSNMIYAGGSFTTTGGQPRNGFVALRDGAATCQSVGSGGSWRVSNWSNCGNAIPGDGDTVEVQAGHTLTVYGNLAIDNLITHAGGELNLPRGSNLTVEGTLTHNGRLTQTLAVPSTTTFLNIKNADGSADRFFGLTLTPEMGGSTPAGDMGNTTVTIRGNQNCTGGSGVKRCFDISPTTPQNATVRLYYTNAELNGQTYNALKLWHWSAGWAQAGDTYTYSATCSTGQINCWIEAKNVSAYSPFGIGSSKQPTAVRMQSFAARTIPAEGGLALVGLLLLGLCGVGVFKVRQ
jgi:hypothetical protein